MTVSGISSSDLQQAWLAKMQQRKQDMSQLGSALQNGDLSGAQKAFADLQSLKASSSQGSAGSSTDNSSSGSSSSANNVDMSQLASMFQGGDLASMLLASGSAGTDSSSGGGTDLMSQLSQGGDLASMLLASSTTNASGGTNSSDLFAALLGQTTAAANTSGTQDVAATTQGLQDKRQQREQDFNQLGTALQSGDLASAQKAFADLQSLRPGGQDQNSSGSGSSAVSGTNSITSDFASLGQALSAGSLTDAQDAFTKIQQDMQSHRGGHHHHHMAAASYSNVSSQTQDTTSSNPSSTLSISV